jgi:NAD(P)-dependent dehydrogenase (short-subunit alcohol dehydrogenase family)
MTTKDKKSADTKKPVWFITGCSTGFGRDLAKHALELGYRTVVTARKPDEVKDLAAKGEALVLRLDVTKQGQINAAIKAAEKKFGGIDVLVNNAGIGYFAAVEESEEKEVRRMFEINVFGMSRMIQAALPGMRRRRKGCIVNISSLAGLRSTPRRGSSWNARVGCGARIPRRGPMERKTAGRNSKTNRWSRDWRMRCGWNCNGRMPPRACRRHGNDLSLGVVGCKPRRRS